MPVDARNPWTPFDALKQESYFMTKETILIAGDNLFLHGGRANLLLDDLVALDLKTNTWVEILAEGHLPSARHKQSCVSQVVGCI